MVGIVGNRRKIFEHLRYAFFNESVVARFLNFNEVGDIDDLVDFTELSSFGFAILVNR